MSLSRLARHALWIVPLLAVPFMVHASIDANSTGLVEAGRAAGLSSICSSNASACVATLVGKFLNMTLGFLGLILFVYMVYGGVLYMSSAGDEKQVKKAKDTLQQAIIGVFLIVLAFGISSFIIDRAVEVTGGQVADGGGGGGGEEAGAPGSGGERTSQTGGSVCRCSCEDGNTELAIPVSACSPSACSVTTCNSSCSALGGSRVAPSCGAVGSICNCECNIGGRASYVDVGSVTGACSVSGSCGTACTNACRVAGGVPSSIGATCDSTRRGDTRVPSARCETISGIGVAPYGARIRAGGLCEYAQRQCDFCMRSHLVNACTTALRDTGVPWSTTQIAVAQGNANATCGATCNPAPESYAILCP